MFKYNIVNVYLLLITANLFPFTIHAFRTFHENGVQIILALENENVIMECKADIPIAYCAFLHSTEKRLSFKGVATNVGSCSINITAIKNYTGEWRCHIGQSAGVEIMKIFELRVVNEIAALETNVTAVHGKSKTLYCITTKGLVPLSYCRFEPPNGLPFSIDSSVTPSKPLLHRYYFPLNKSLDRGDCVVTIRNVEYEDMGIWSCGAGLDDGKEYIDVFNFEVTGFYMSTSSVIGVSFGVTAIIAVLAIIGFTAWKKRTFLGSHDIPMNAGVLEQMPSSKQAPSTGSRQAPSRQKTPELGKWKVPQIVIQSPSVKSAGQSSPLTASTED